MRYVIWGWAEVFDRDGEPVRDLHVLRQLAGFVDKEDLFATDFIGGTPIEDEIAVALERSGQLRFALFPGEAVLPVQSTCIARRPLSTAELDWLRSDTLGQWSDGMGECLFVPNGAFKGFKHKPLSEHEVRTSDYPFVDLVE